ncbi:MAG: SpaA isopeptide-forming pilin-related protein [Coriobacteriia bacterium]|nr:SpaA isopeptide-forming pilin-related protein [Coriobacteriia bacterium]
MMPALAVLAFADEAEEQLESIEGLEELFEQEEQGCEEEMAPDEEVAPDEEEATPAEEEATPDEEETMPGEEEETLLPQDVTTDGEMEEEEQIAETKAGVRGPVVARGAPLTPLGDAPGSISGRFTLTPGWYCDWTYIGDFPGTISLYGGYTVVSFGCDSSGTNGYIPCMSPGAANWGDSANADNRSGTLYASFFSINPTLGIAWYWIDYIEPDIEPAVGVYGVQYLGGAWLAIQWELEGVIELVKKDAHPAITTGNNLYSLAGAQYGVYGSSTDALNDTDRITLLTTDASGYAKSDSLPQATYYVKELTASEGYLLDPTIYTVDLNDTIYTLEVDEMPASTPVGVLVQKLDSTTGKAYGVDDPTGQGLAGAQFTISYYDGYYTTAEKAIASGDPTRTWVLETGVGGVASLDAKYLVAAKSDALYTDSAGKPSVPLGTILIQETKAPARYLLPSPNTPDLQQIKLDTTLYKVSQLNAVVVLEEPHILELIKVDANTKKRVGGAEFVLYRESKLGAGDWKKIAERTTGSDGGFKVSPMEVGSYKLVETKAPAGYQLPTESGLPEEILFTIESDTALKVIEAKDYKKGTITPSKIDMVTKDPIAGTEFTLFQYPVTLKDGEITTDTSLITADTPGWVEVGRVITGADGKAVFKELTFGYYLLVETCPDPNYASYEESGGGDRFVTLDKYATGETQLFEDMIIQISCEVYKKTIAITSSGLNGSEEGTGSNVGHEEYLYRFGARSTSNVWADEFIVIDDLTYVTSLGYRMTVLWTGTSPVGMDFDNKLAVLYRTNMTDPSEPVVFRYNPLHANPENPNNPSRNMVYSNEPGWRIWAEELPTTHQSRLDVADLNLQEGEYIIGLKIVFGGVDTGFFTGNGWQIEEDPHTIKSSDSIALISVDPETLLEDWWYSVVATEGLRPLSEMGDETVMRGSVSADITRNNGVLTDNDIDAVETRVIEPFMFPTESNGLVWEPIPVRNPPQRPGAFPRTGDQALLLGAVPIALIAGFVLLQKSRRQRKHKEEEAE